MTIEKSAQLSADADAAADVIERQGWYQGSLQHPVTGAVCAAGAVRVAVDLQVKYGTPDWQEAADRYNAVVDALRAQLGGWSVPRWNDSAERNADEVIGAFRDLATKHRPDEMTETHL